MERPKLYRDTPGVRPLLSFASDHPALRTRGAAVRRRLRVNTSQKLQTHAPIGPPQPVCKSPPRWKAPVTAEFSGATLPLAWGLPFVGLLMSFAVAPLIAPRLWHAHYGKVAAAWALALIAPFAATFGVSEATHRVIYRAILDGDVEAAQAAMRAHLSLARDILLKEIGSPT